MHFIFWVLYRKSLNTIFVSLGIIYSMKIIIESLKQNLQKYTKDLDEVTLISNEIVRCYEGRAYHNLQHLNSIYKELIAIKPMIENWEAIFYAICYHDIVYDIDKFDNELQSAIIAKERLSKLKIPHHTIERSYSHILATQKHQKSGDSDTNLFIDADLSILASDKYQEYLNGIRKEYAKYSDIEFEVGRRKVVEYFLSQDRIYHSDYFYDRYEERARENLRGELLV